MKKTNQIMKVMKIQRGKLKYIYIFICMCGFGDRVTYSKKTPKYNKLENSGI